MTKKHFIAIAAILKENHASPELVKALAAEFANLNPNFDSARFINASLGDSAK